VKTERPQRDRKGEILFIDARNMGTMVTRTLRELSDEEIARIADTYNAWRGEPDLDPYQDTPGFRASVTVNDVIDQDYVLTPGRYVGSESGLVDDEPVEERIKRLGDAIREGFTQRHSLQHRVQRAINSLQVSANE